MFSQSVIDKVRVIAAGMNVEPAALLAVAQVESAGVTLWPTAQGSMPPIRFEGHYFFKLTSGDAHKKAVAAGLASPVAGAVKNPNGYQARYDMLARAVAIDPVAALESTSWGLGQVMGANWRHLGFGSVTELADMAKASVDGQIQIMASYIKAFYLVDELKTHGWKRFAEKYNGPAQASNNYAAKIQAAYLLYSKQDPVAHVASNGDPQVKTYQGTLKKLGYNITALDGSVGPETMSAVESFQTDHGLVADGKFGPMTDQMIDKVVASKANVSGDSIVKTGTGITGIGAIGDSITAQADQLRSVAEYSHLIQMGVTVLVVGGVVVALYGLYNKYLGRSQPEV